MSPRKRLTSFPFENPTPIFTESNGVAKKKSAGSEFAYKIRAAGL
jgi:hypothetical protein